MDIKKLRIAENAINRISMHEGKTVDEIKREIKNAIIIGLNNRDLHVQAYWKDIPCEGEIPTPEEVIVYPAEKLKSNHSAQHN